MEVTQPPCTVAMQAHGVRAHGPQVRVQPLPVRSPHTRQTERHRVSRAADCALVGNGRERLINFAMLVLRPRLSLRALCLRLVWQRRASAFLPMLGRSTLVHTPRSTLVQATCDVHTSTQAHVHTHAHTCTCTCTCTHVYMYGMTHYNNKVPHATKSEHVRVWLFPAAAL